MDGGDVGAVLERFLPTAAAVGRVQVDGHRQADDPLAVGERLRTYHGDTGEVQVPAVGGVGVLERLRVHLLQGAGELDLLDVVLSRAQARPYGDDPLAERDLLDDGPAEVGRGIKLGIVEIIEPHAVTLVALYEVDLLDLVAVPEGGEAACGHAGITDLYGKCRLDDVTACHEGTYPYLREIGKVQCPFLLRIGIAEREVVYLLHGAR